MKRRILFVDDEPRVLDGLKRMLRGMRHEWEMSFAGSGEAALNILAQESFDVVVSDMRMPGMDGAVLLTEVMKRYPWMVRMVLSGHSEREMILKSVQPAHQYLSKPCDPEKLRSSITRACALRVLLADDSLKQIVSQIDRLPSVPSLYLEVMKELRGGEGSVHKVGEIISKDLGMAAKVLQIVNSAFFGVPRHIESPAQAVSLLGLETVKALVLSVQVFSQVEEEKLAWFSLERLLRHSVRTGTLAKEVAGLEGQEKAMVDDAFMGGLLHDSGKLVLAANLPDRYREALGAASDKGIALWEAEREVFGTTHSDVGAYLMGLWGLPDPIVEAIAFHHSPAECPDRIFRPLTSVHVANALEYEGGTDKEETPRNLDADYLTQLNLVDHIPAWQACSRQFTEQGATDA